MKRLILLLSIFFIVSIQFSMACSCIGPTTFCEDITDSDGNIYESSMIVRAKILQKDGEGINVEIQETIFGDLDEEEIYIPQGYGADCSMSINGFEVDKEYVLVLWERSHDTTYYLNICQVSVLEIENEVISGNIAPGIESLDYHELGNLEGCGEEFKIFSISKQIAVFPNPTIDILNIKNLSALGTIENVRIECIDIIGKEHCLFIKENGIIVDETWSINLESLSSGVYIFKLYANQQDAIFKIVKQ